MRVQPGSRLGPYEIVASLGAGGMGEVFRARDTRLDRTVAIKVLPAEFAASAALKLRFEREARAISQLNHTNICTLHDIGSDAGVEYLVMELIEGETLADRLRKGPLPLSDVLRYGTQIADALHAAHRVGIVHRDLKPGNVMLTRAGAKLLDFGLAKRNEPIVGPDAPTEQHKPLTAEGTIVGTFEYMAPEQLEGEEADARTDIFALGCVLYEMVTGQRAFDGRTRSSLIAAIVATDPRPISSLQPLSPAALEHLIAGCLRKERDARWQSAHDVAEQLRWIERAPQSAPEAPRRRWRSAALVAAALAGGLLPGALVSSLLGRAEEDAAVYSAINPPRDHLIGTNSEAKPVISPDGKMIAFLAAGEDLKGRIWVRQFNSSEARPIAGTDGGFHPFWSPDGKQLGFFTDGKLKKVAIDGSPPVTLCDVGSNPRGGAWSPDGVIIFAHSSLSGLHRISDAGGKPEAVTTLDSRRGEDTHRWPRFLPDGKRFLYSAGNAGAAENSDTNAIFASELGSTERRLVLYTRYHVELVGKHLLFVRGDTLYAQEFDAEALQLLGAPREIARELEVEPDILAAAFTAAADKLVYSTGVKRRDVEFFWLGKDAKEAGKVMIKPDDYETWSLSPDGSRLAVSVTDPSEGTDIWVHDLARGTATPLTRGGNGVMPAWSPDGRRIAYFARRSNELVIKDFDSETAAKPLWKARGFAGPDAWSPDGKYIVLTTFDPKTPTDYDAALIPADGKSQPVPIANTNAEEFANGFSPDGRWLMYISNASGQYEVYAVAFPELNRKQQLSAGGADAAVWVSPNEIWHVRRRDGMLTSVRVEEKDRQLQLSPPRTLGKVNEILGFASAPQHDRILASRFVGERERPQLVLVTGWQTLLKRGS